MCICCREVEAEEPLGLCANCVIDVRGDVTNGIHELEVYLEHWAAFEEWLDRRRRL
jgi:hypothetical protein